MVAAMLSAPLALALPAPSRFPPFAALAPMVAPAIAIIAVIIAIAAIILAIRRPPALRGRRSRHKSEKAAGHGSRKEHHGTRHYNLLSVMTERGLSTAIFAGAEPAVKAGFRVGLPPIYPA